ncbi:hypothetical protein VLK31_23340 [Variovorax sp. H27-G14]|uniref:hypothetical protein n=1 Tax=Variovorax sp. H27-G14 TaxID=3111914 RepID=UPI0038FCCCF5
MLCAIALLAACATPADRDARSSRSPVVDLSLAQALTPQAKGARVHWSGGISAIDAR